MTAEAFYAKAARVLEIPAADAATRFRDVPGWCSLMAFGLLVLLENDAGRPMDVATFLTKNTLGELFA